MDASENNFNKSVVVQKYKEDGEDLTPYREIYKSFYSNVSLHELKP